MPKWFIGLMLTVSGGITLFGFLGFLGWMSDPSPNKWGALFCCVFGIGCTLFFRHLWRNPRALGGGTSDLPQSQQATLISIFFLMLLVPFVNDKYEDAVGKPNSILEHIGEFAVSGIASVTIFFVIRFIVKKSAR